MRKKRTGLQQISLSEEQKERLREEIRAFYLDERGDRDYRTDTAAGSVYGEAGSGDL